LFGSGGGFGAAGSSGGSKEGAGEGAEGDGEAGDGDSELFGGGQEVAPVVSLSEVPKQTGEEEEHCEFSGVA
jgi:hypothetical protein